MSEEEFEEYDNDFGEIGGDGDVEDVYVEESSESWFGRLGKSVSGILTGLIIFLIAFPLLFWNEGRAVKRYKTLKEGGGVVVSVPTDRPDPANNGKLVHITGLAQTKEILSDPLFGVSKNAVKLKRTVKMYQWDEETETRKKKKLGGGEKTITIYKYRKKWSESIINSNGFRKREGHENPRSMPVKSKTIIAKKVNIGGFRLPTSLVDKISGYEPLMPDPNFTPPSIGGKRARLINQEYYVGDTPSSPMVGDLRIGFQYLSPKEVSIIAMQKADTFAPYQTKAGGTIELLTMGKVSSKDMFKMAETSNKLLTWIIRIGGFFLMFLGIGMILRPLSVVLDVIPLLGSIAETGTGILAFLIAGVFSFITIAIAWFVYRPLWGIILIAVAALFAAGIFFVSKEKNRGGAPQPKRRTRRPPPSPGPGTPPPPPPVK